MGAVWSDERRFTRWLDVEIAAMAGWAELGVVPADAVSAVRERARVDVARIGEIEDRTHHDVLAFTESVGRQGGAPRRRVRYGPPANDRGGKARGRQRGDAVPAGAGIGDGLAQHTARLGVWRKTLPIASNHSTQHDDSCFVQRRSGASSSSG